MPKLELAFRPGVTTEVSIDDANLLFYATHQATAEATARGPDPERAIEDALAHPIGTPPLEDLVGAHDRVMILVDDITRPTPAGAILPHLLRRLHAAGVPEDAVTIFIAMGTHRTMTKEEIRAKLGDEIPARYRVVNRDYRLGPFADLGETPSGTPIYVNQDVLAADFLIAVGNVVPHISAGWGGGSKMILPGVCSRRTSDRMHLMACTVQPVLEVLGTRDNRPRAEMDAVAAQVGLDFIVNVVMDEDKHLLGAYAGHYIEAHRAACRQAEEVMVVPIPAQADILIVSANPCYFDYWQGIKAYAYAHRAVREGGVMIFLLDAEEGLCGDAPTHEPVLREYMQQSFEAQVVAVERGEVEDLVGLNVPMYHAMVHDRVRRTILVTNHMSAEDAALLEFDVAPRVQAALERAYALLGRDATVGVIPFGGETLTRVAPVG
jgi:nickel-dependent lactate racemase